MYYKGWQSGLFVKIMWIAGLININLINTSYKQQKINQFERIASTGSSLEAE
jgi:hypothetical protein